MHIDIQVSNKWLMGLVVALLFVAALDFVQSYNDANPTVIGHHWSDIGGKPVGLDDGDNDYCAEGTCPGNLDVAGIIKTDDGLCVGSNCAGTGAKVDIYSSASELLLGIFSESPGTSDIVSITGETSGNLVEIHNEGTGNVLKATGQNGGFTVKSDGTIQIQKVSSLPACNSDSVGSMAIDSNNEFRVCSYSMGCEYVTVCAEIREDRSETLYCPSDMRFSDDVFDIYYSGYYGSPGACGSYEIPAGAYCVPSTNTANSCVGYTSCALNSNNDLCGDPHANRGKIRYAELRCRGSCSSYKWIHASSMLVFM